MVRLNRLTFARCSARAEWEIFSVYWGLNQSGTMPFIGNVTSLTAVAIKANAEVTLLEAFEGVNIIIAVNRLMLFAQYCRGM